MLHGSTPRWHRGADCARPRRTDSSPSRRRRRPQAGPALRPASSCRPRGGTRKPLHRVRPSTSSKSHPVDSNPQLSLRWYMPTYGSDRHSSTLRSRVAAPQTHTSGHTKAIVADRATRQCRLRGGTLCDRGTARTRARQTGVPHTPKTKRPPRPHEGGSLDRRGRGKLAAPTAAHRRRGQLLRCSIPHHGHGVLPPTTSC